nr:MAG TPA: zinc finger protein [Caudoviricetes sp.]
MDYYIQCKWWNECTTIPDCKCRRIYYDHIVRAYQKRIYFFRLVYME